MPVTIVGNNTPTAGGVVYGDGTNYASTAAGTSGQVLQSNGASAPSWVTTTTPGMSLVSTLTASNSAALEWTGLSGSNNYILIVNNLIQAVSGFLNIVYGTGSTPTYVTSGYTGWLIYANSTTPAATAQGTTRTNLHFANGTNPVSGSYFINNLTISIKPILPIII